MPTNDIVPFCPNDIGTNLLTQSQYLASPYLPIGNQPGVASSKLVNKAIRQATFVAAALAQFLVNVTGNNVLDDGNLSNLIATMTSAFGSGAPVISVLSGSGTYNVPVGTKYLELEVRGAGGGGASGLNNGSSGGNTTFGISLLTANGGSGAVAQVAGAGGSSSIAGGASGLALNGATGSGGSGVSAGSGAFTDCAGGSGGGAGGGGGGTGNPTAGAQGVDQSGGGGGGGGTAAGGGGGFSGGGGGEGGNLKAIIPPGSLASSYSYSVGLGGTGGVGGSSGGNTYSAGAKGGDGVIYVKAYS